MFRVHKTVVLNALALVPLWGCSPARKEPASAITMADPATAKQLIFGFYQVEDNAWRWTGRKFSVALKPPPNAEQRGAKLRLSLYLPGIHLEQLGAVTLCADVDGHTLDSETFSNTGTSSYIRDVPADFLVSNVAPVNFTLDQAAGPTPAEGRELGAVVTAVALEPY